MVCVAAFIVLALLSVFVAVLSIFRRDIGAKYWVTFKKAWGCVWKKVRLQKCETNFKDDIKNSILSKVVVRKPKLVKPISAGIEVAAVLIVALTVWSLVEGAKAGLSLWVFGTCNVSQPSNCSLSADVCGIDQAEPKNPLEAAGRWFTEWGEIFVGIPDRIRRWDAKQYLPQNTSYWSYDASRATALDIFDPGCAICLASFRNQQADGFFDRYNVAYIPYVIVNPSTGADRFPNSRLVASYLTAIRLAEVKPSDGTPYDWRILERIFTASDQNGINYQEAIKRLDATAATNLLDSWLLEFGASPIEIDRVRNLSESDEVKDALQSYRHIVDDRINAKGIPTLIFGGRRHTGLYE
ncbi:MAG: hypothetical protein LBM12_00695 [Candidatus Nomurabacteria bacterium]|jgi:hypothetical protein|nr:hypothetical protein [Candidatus Nomurabacteria bacterium]